MCENCGTSGLCVVCGWDQGEVPLAGWTTDVGEWHEPDGGVATISVSPPTVASRAGGRLTAVDRAECPGALSVERDSTGAVVAVEYADYCISRDGVPFAVECDVPDVDVVEDFADRLRVDAGYALGQLRRAFGEGVSRRVVDDAVQRAFDALERIVGRLDAPHG